MTRQAPWGPLALVGGLVLVACQAQPGPFQPEGGPQSPPSASPAPMASLAASPQPPAAPWAAYEAPQQQSRPGVFAGRWEPLPEPVGFAPELPQGTPTPWPNVATDPHPRPWPSGMPDHLLAGDRLHLVPDFAPQAGDQWALVGSTGGRLGAQGLLESGSPGALHLAWRRDGLTRHRLMGVVDPTLGASELPVGRVSPAGPAARGPWFAVIRSSAEWRSLWADWLQQVPPWRNELPPHEQTPAFGPAPALPAGLGTQGAVLVLHPGPGLLRGLVPTRWLPQDPSALEVVASEELPDQQGPGGQIRAFWLPQAPLNLAVHLKRLNPQAPQGLLPLLLGNGRSGTPPLPSPSPTPTPWDGPAGEVPRLFGPNGGPPYGSPNLNDACAGLGLNVGGFGGILIGAPTPTPPPSIGAEPPSAWHEAPAAPWTLAVGQVLRLGTFAFPGPVRWRSQTPHTGQVGEGGLVRALAPGPIWLEAEGGGVTRRVLIASVAQPQAALRFAFRADLGLPADATPRQPAIFRDAPSFQAFWAKAFQGDREGPAPNFDASRENVVLWVHDRMSGLERTDPVMTHVDEAGVVHLVFPGLSAPPQHGGGYHRAIRLLLTGKLPAHASVRAHSLCDP